MNTHIKNTWLAALREPGLKKARHQLKDCDGGISPGGILCDLAVGAGIIPEPLDLTSKEGRSDPMFFGWTYQREGVSIPQEVAKWAEIAARSVWHIDYKSDCGASFHQIADYIKENY